MSDQYDGSASGDDQAQWQPPSSPPSSPPSPPQWAPPVPGPPSAPAPSTQPATGPYGVAPAGGNPYLAPPPDQIPTYGDAGHWSAGGDEPKKSNKGLVIGIVLVLLVVVLGGAVVGARALLGFEPDDGGDWAVRIESMTAKERVELSGVMVAVDGFAVTKASSVVGADEVRVFLGGADDSSPAVVVGIAECSDLALVQVDAKLATYDALPWADAAPGVGTTVYATGYSVPGHVYGATEGVIGSVNGSVVMHSAPVADGFVGGALVTDGGDIAGINVGGGRAISAAEAAAVRINSSDAIGFVAQESSAGLQVLAVVPDSPAAATGLRAGDLIQAAGSVSFGASDTMETYCEMAALADGPIELAVERDGVVLAGAIGGQALAGASGANDVAIEYQTAVDATGSLRFDVPADWSVDGRPTGDDGEPLDDKSDGFPDLLAEGEEGYVNMFYVDTTSDIESQIDEALTGWGCTALEAASPYDDGAYVGLLVPYDCEPGFTSFLVIAEDAEGIRVLVDIAVNDMPRSAAIATNVLDTFSG